MSGNTIKSNIFYVTICQYPEESLPNTYRVRPYVNEIIIVHNHPIIAQVKAEFDDLKATLHYVDWKEDFSYKRTQYIRKTGDIIKEKGSDCGYTKNNTWMLVSDIDEFPSIALLSNLQTLIAKAEIEKSTICTINAHDYLIKGEGTSEPFTFIPRPLEEILKEEIVGQNISNYHKELLIKYQDKLEYTGKVHHTLRGSGLRIMQAPKEYYYDHIKKDADMHSHGCRNWFIGGGGVQEFGPKWKTLRGITNKYGLDSWEKMEKAMKIGNIQSDIKQFFVDHKDDNDTSSDSEVRSFYSYYKMLHEDELKGIVQTVKTVVTKDGIKDPIPKSQKIVIDDKDVNIKNGLYYDPTWKRDYLTQSKNPDKSVSLNVPKISPIINPKINVSSIEKVVKLDNEITKIADDDHVKDMNFQEVKISSNASNLPEVNIFNPRSKEPFPSEKLHKSNVKLEDKDEIEEFVDDTYIKILGRSADDGGLKTYTSLIIEHRLKKEDLADIFRKSEEYIEKGLET